MPTTLPPAKQVIMDTLGCVAHADGTHLSFSAASGIPIKESTTEDADDPANGVPLEGCAALFLHGGKIYKRLTEGGGIAEVASADVPENAGALTGSMGTARQGHSATLLEDGRILIAGGSLVDASIGGGYPRYATCEIYDPETGEFTATGSMSAARFFHGAVLLADGTVLVAGGYGDSGYMTGCEIYDPNAGTWSATGSLGTARVLGALILLNDDTVLFISGDGGSADATCEIWDAGTWSATGSLAVGRYKFAAVKLADGRVLVAGGEGGGGANLDCEIFDAGTWSSTGDISIARNFPAASLLADGTVLLSGGTDASGNYLASSETFDPDTDTWSASGSMATGRNKHFSFTLADGYVHVIGGESAADTPTVSCEQWTDGVFAATGDLVSARLHCTATLLDDGATVLVAGGAAAVDVDAMATCEIYGLVTDLGFVKIQGAQTITGAKNFTGGLTKNGEEVATVAESVTLAGEQTITGAKTFSATTTLPGATFGDEDEANISSKVSFNDNVGFFGVTPVAQQTTVTSPTGGVVQDAEARSSIDEIKAILTAFGLTN